MLYPNKNIQENLPRFTGRQLVSVNPRSQVKTILKKAKEMSLDLVCFEAYKNKEDYYKAFEEGDGILFKNCGVAVVNSHKVKEISELVKNSNSKDTFYYYEPERYVYAYSDDFKQYLKGYKAAIDHIYQKLMDDQYRSSKVQQTEFRDNEEASWGIQATKILESEWTGKGTKIAILDTGFNLNHPDFKDRKINSKSFIAGEEVEDLNGHGTHCTGIAAGNSNQETGRRYGVAHGAEIFIGKVLSNAGSGSDSGILAGIEWAISNGCQVISMSLGAPVREGESYSNIYNDLAKKAMSQGTLIIAAAGNESRRDLGHIAPVGHPANCPAIMAVGALDHKLQMGYFSNGSINTDGGQIDVAAPGVEVYSAWKSPDNYNTISGTSMATPFVSGIAALYWQENPKASAADIRAFLTQNAKRLDLPSSDVGAGLVQPPKNKRDLKAQNLLG